MRRILAFAFLLALGAGLLFIAQPVATAAPDPAEVSGAESVGSFSGAIGAAGGAAITSTTANRRAIIKSMVVASDTAGVVVFRDGQGGTILGQVYLAQNTPLNIRPDELGDGMAASAGNAVWAELSSATLTVTYRLKFD